MMDALRGGDADMIIGSRFLDHRSSSFRLGPMKTAAIAFFRGLIYRTTGARLTDPTSGFKGVSFPVFSHYAKQNEFPADFPDADILIRTLLQQYRIKEIPVHMRPREQGVSMHSGLKPVMYMMKILLSVFIVVLNDRLARRRTS